ncbi:hypothetical protein BD289DRAFT_458943 [Coniella lustricola]|uniref:Centromere protein Cenp-K n=1 Tax=Coniella lustricola TaxID=2025994 RepID=A0A2T3AH35_9PEZI|nr:hypothetical protein BD289DRAFT_458943 [Coniella lustricola]
MEAATELLGSEDLHTTYLERSRKELETKIAQLKRSLAEENERFAVASSQRRTQDAGKASVIGAKQQLNVIAEAYRRAAATEPFLPFPDSVVPALVALRTTSSTIDESKKFLASQKLSLEKARDRLEAEQASLIDQKALKKALEDRAQSLRDGIESRGGMSPDQIARNKVSGLKTQIKETNTDRSRLLKVLGTFIDNRLAVLLAAEQIGGPVTGEMMDIDSETLDAGFSATGKRKKAKPDAAPDKRQRRIDDMLRDAPHGADDAVQELDRKAAAGEEMQRLVEELMNGLLAAQGSHSDAYISVPEETASVRFLTRVKVAEFHPRNSKRLRLVDFGREIGD